MALRRRRRRPMRHNGHHPHILEYPIGVLRRVLDGIADFAVFSFFRWVLYGIAHFLGWIIRAIFHIFH